MFRVTVSLNIRTHSGHNYREEFTVDVADPSEAVTAAKREFYRSKLDRGMHSSAFRSVSLIGVLRCEPLLEPVPA